MSLRIKSWNAGLGTLQLSNLRRALEREGMTTAWWSDVPGTRIATHAHDFPEARWVLSGYLRVRVGTDTLELGPGDRIDLPAGTPHALEVVGLSPVIYVTGMPEADATTPGRQVAT